MKTDNEKYNETVQPNTAFLNELKEKLPEFFTKEDSFDLDKFRNLLKDKNVNELSEGYQLDFIGKDYARRQAGEMSSTVIVPDEKQNQGEGKNSKNLFFTGDNLEVLRHLQNNYQNKIDVIYIDPPYNTGSDGFVYPDNFEYNDDQLKNMFGLDDDQVERLKSIQGKSSHSAWLTFMYPRLSLAKKLLSETGTMFISIDDNEGPNLKEICDELFGEINFVSNIIWNSRKSVSNDAIISLNHNATLIYSKNLQVFNNKKDGFKLPLSKDGFNNPDNDSRGVWKADPFDSPGIRPNLTYKIKNPNTGEEYLPPEGRCWRTGPNEYNQLLNDHRIVFGKNGTSKPQLKRFYSEVKSKGQTAKSIWDDVGTTTDGTREIQRIFGEKLFSTPKPTSLIKKILKLSTNGNSEIVLDFFAGSSTTADAVMQLNAEDGGHRKFIMVQLPEKTYHTNKDGKEEPTKGGKVAYEDGFKSIDQISRERIRRAAKKIYKDNELTLPKGYDGSFKHYRVVKPIKQTLEDIEDFDPNNTNLFTNMVDGFSSQSLEIAGDSTGEDTIFTTWLAKDGYSFDANVEEIKFGNYTAHQVENNRLYLINEGWGAAQTKGLLNQLGTHQLEVQSVVLFGYSFNVAGLRELENGLKQLDSKVTLIKRY
ncbi:site-specific DNA-methyltransferase [Lactiplantibacillus pentosus]|jgi:adenine-specific DNA-methyltransferase|uniref:site-specific DNA-methyltransferase n=1 Tax=Lactiplantibacillus pentosus TaxID=1589 RepID=UPI00259BCC81|nr:site-specific DNA-methyltransferase [Lactiplantibacillus pentosus]WFC04186.1 DNA methyltransferase [Lactiplantibacillus pentosus]